MHKSCSVFRGHANFVKGVSVEIRPKCERYQVRGRIGATLVWGNLVAGDRAVTTHGESVKRNSKIVSIHYGQREFVLT